MKTIAIVHVVWWQFWSIMVRWNIIIKLRTIDGKMPQCDEGPLSSDVSMVAECLSETKYHYQATYHRWQDVVVRQNTIIMSRTMSRTIGSKMPWWDKILLTRHIPSAARWQRSCEGACSSDFETREKRHRQASKIEQVKTVNKTV